MVRANFTDGNNYTEAPGLTQWDYGQVLEIHGLDLPKAVEIHFAIYDCPDDAIIRIGNTVDKITRAAIPEKIMEQSQCAVAYVYVSDTQSGETVRTVYMPMIPRQKPEAFDAPEDAELFKETIEMVNAAADRAELAKSDAETARDVAQSTADETEADRAEVEALKSQAQTAAESALLSEHNANVSETAAQTAQAGAETAEGQAELFAGQAEESKNFVEAAKAVVMELGQKVADDKSNVEQAVSDFEIARQNAVQEIKDAENAALKNIGTGIDDTLTQSGKAADAKETGDKLSKLKDDLVNLIGSEFTYNLDWILNEYVQKDGLFASYNGWKRTDYTEIPSGETELFFDVEITYDQEYNCFYDENNTLITAFSITASKKVSIPQNAKYFVLSCPTSLNIDVYGSHIDGEIDNIKNEINDMKSDGIPSYYREHLSSKEGIIRGRNEYSVNGDSFVFITDYHREHNTENSIPLVKSIVENTGTHFVVFGGDAYNSRASKDSARNYIRDFCKKFNGIPCDTFFTVGNHEYNTEEIKLSQNDVYAQMLKRNEFKYVSTDGLDYAFDNETKRIRYIVYGCQQNAGIFTFQVVWLAQQLRDLPNNYNVVMISHVGVSDDGTTNHAFLNETLAVINAFKTKSQIYKIDTNYDYSNTTSNFLFIISGHSHRDCVVTLENGIKIISTTCDAYRGECGGLTRTQGTITEQAFDVVNFNLEKRVVYLTRIGAGEDREISY